MVPGSWLLANARPTLSRAAFVSVLACGLLILSACGGHKKTAHQKVTPPPTVTPAPSNDATASADTTPKNLRTAKPIYVETGLASWYGPPYDKHKGANGEIYDQNAMTAAHRTLPLNTIVRVTNLETHKTVKIKINDRGPFGGGRIIDLSERAAHELGIVDDGVARVKLEVFQSDQPGTDQAASAPSS